MLIYYYRYFYHFLVCCNLINDLNIHKLKHKSSNKHHHKTPYNHQNKIPYNFQHIENCNFPYMSHNNCHCILHIHIGTHTSN